ncbi:MAG: hypothetical protein GX846_11005 [Deltaproteobacteria bacterium]|nr:hypothetical protein [Deltaproteobacteria bacterium]
MRNSNELRNNIKERIQRESLDNARSNNLLERARPRSQQDIKKQAPEVRKGKANPYEIRIADLPEERIKRDTRSYEQRKADAPSVKNSPEKSPDSSGRTAYPRPVRPEAKQAPLTAPSVQKNVTRSLQSKTPEEKPSSEASPFSLAPDRTKSEIKPKQGSSPRSAVKREPGKEKRARPGIEKIKR